MVYDTKNSFFWHSQLNTTCIHEDIGIYTFTTHPNILKALEWNFYPARWVGHTGTGRSNHYTCSMRRVAE